MKINYLNIAFASAIFTLSGCTTTQTISQQSSEQQATKVVHTDSHANHHEHGHAEHHEYAHWGYTDGSITPEHWGDIEVNKLCKIGKSQSPINIQKTTTTTDKFNLNANYQAQNFTVKNNGHTIVFNAKNPSQSKLNINGTTYELLQFHYHVPSEHTVMNAFYPLELHFVHKNSDNGLAVVGVLVDKGEQNNELAKILTNLPADDKKDGELTGFNVNTLMPKNSPTYAYEGSLTTPPCDEQVQWLLKANPIHASTAQLQVLSALYDGNNRPVQPQGNRTVHLVK